MNYCSHLTIQRLFNTHLTPPLPTNSHNRWFTIGSIGFVLTGAVTLANSYDSGKLMGEDDSTLDLRDYRATWWLVVVSGWFCILGRFIVLLCLFQMVRQCAL